MIIRALNLNVYDYLICINSLFSILNVCLQYSYIAVANAKTRVCDNDMCVYYGYVGEEAIVRSVSLTHTQKLAQKCGGLPHRTHCSNTQTMWDSLKAMADSRKRKLNRVDFFGDYITAFRQGIHTDVIVKPGDDGPGIPAHKAILVTSL